VTDRRKLRLVRPERDERAAREDEAQPLAGRGEEVGVAAELARAAAGRGRLDPADHEVLLALTLGEEVAEVSPRERQQAEALGRALEARASADEPSRAEGEGDVPEDVQPLVDLAEAVRAAARPAALDELSSERLIQQALRRARPGRRAGWRFALAAAAAVAAGLALFVGTGPWTSGPAVVERPEPVELIKARSAQSLFDPTTPFPPQGGETARIDRIAQARAAELRANRFASWGVR